MWNSSRRQAGATQECRGSHCEQNRNQWSCFFCLKDDSNACPSPPPILKPSIRNSGGLSSMACGRRTARRARRSSSSPARVRQDQHPGAPGGPPDRQWRRSPADSADDLLAPGRRRDDAAGRADRAKGDGRACRHHDRCAGLGRHLPWDRRAAVARLCRPDRPRSQFHHSRPRGFRRPDESGPARARLLEDGEPVSDQRAPVSPSIRAP